MPEENMKLIFVSTPYSANSWAGVKDNILDAEILSVQLIARGWAVITPAKNTALYEKYEKLLDGKGYDFWIKLYKCILERCDAIILSEGWEDSKGAMGEYRHAGKKRIPIFFECDGIPEPEDIS